MQRDRRPDASAPEVTYGLRAGAAVLERRIAEVVSVDFAPELRRELTPLLREAAARRVPCREQPEMALERLSHARNHEGLVVTAAPRRWLRPADLGELLTKSRGVAIGLDRVRNPYNVGAVLRSAAFFGVRAALFGAQARDPALAPDAIRVAEGGVEHLALCRTTDLADTLARLRSGGVRVIGADGEGRAEAVGYAFSKPMVLVMGNEREGMSERVRACCDDVVAIRGSGAIESLNVAVAAGVLIAEATRTKS